MLGFCMVFAWFFSTSLRRRFWRFTTRRFVICWMQTRRRDANTTSRWWLAGRMRSTSATSPTSPSRARNRCAVQVLEEKNKCETCPFFASKSTFSIYMYMYFDDSAPNPIPVPYLNRIHLKYPKIVNKLQFFF